MRVAEILRGKGSGVKTISPSETVDVLAERLNGERIGVMVVIGTGGDISGIVSERDIARGFATHGAALSGQRVSDIMTKAVITCTADDSISGISKVMTVKRVRHLPVVDGRQLIGLVSIGDILKARLDEMELEANVLREYAIALR